MQRSVIHALEPTELGDNAEVRNLSAALAATDLAVNHYRIPPGEEFPSGLHAHGDQEEVFVVLDGAATFQRLGSERDEAAEIAVEEGEVVRFAPGEYQSGRNAGDGLLAVLALGAPPDSGDVRIPLDCPECGHGYLSPDVSEAGDAGVTLDCPACGAANVPQGCPDCGAEMRVALGEGVETVVRCPDCGGAAESPFES
ncbi:cupin domain-containing protein [Halorussus salinus]|uniref:cupin domain-containing protein n=1 Tax=Halorussus salinus TaxID=1364935 RepID=UPI0010922ADD|nr:cupin domain-containing protein [Halorussus salinus]